MNKEIENYINNLFSAYGGNVVAEELKNLLLQDLNDCFLEHIAGGKTEQTAIALSLETLGDIKATLAEITNNDILDEKPASAKTFLKKPSADYAFGNVGGMNDAYFKDTASTKGFGNVTKATTIDEPTNSQGFSFENFDSTKSKNPIGREQGNASQNCGGTYSSATSFTGDKEEKNSSFDNTMANFNFNASALSGRSFAGITYHNGSFNCSAMNSCNFSGSDLGNVSITSSSAGNANFFAAKLDRCNFRASALADTNFEQAKLTLCQFKASALRNASFKDASLSNCGFHTSSLPSSNFTSTTIFKTNFNMSDISNAIFCGTNFQEIQFIAMEMRKARFLNCNFNNCLFKMCDLRKLNFENTTFQNIEFSRCYFKNSSFSGATLINVLFAGITSKKYIKDIATINFEGAKMDKLTHNSLLSMGIALPNVYLI